MFKVRSKGMRLRVSYVTCPRRYLCVFHDTCICLPHFDDTLGLVHSACKTLQMQPDKLIKLAEFLKNNFNEDTYDED